MVEEKLSCLVQQWTAGQLGAATDFHQASFHQILQHAFDGDAAHRFNVGARDWLAISDNGESFEGRRRKTGQFRRGKKLTDPARAVGMTYQLPPFGFVDELEATWRQSVIAF